MTIRKQQNISAVSVRNIHYTIEDRNADEGIAKIALATVEVQMSDGTTKVLKGDLKQHLPQALLVRLNTDFDDARAHIETLVLPD